MVGDTHDPKGAPTPIQNNDQTVGAVGTTGGKNYATYGERIFIGFC